MTFTKEEADRIIADVRANQAKLAECNNHLFEAIDAEKFGTDFRCKHCGGKISGPNVHWYMVGRAHGMANGTHEPH